MDESFGFSLLDNFVANLASALLIALFSVAVVLVVLRVRRRKLRAFFGLSGGGSVRVFLSRIAVNKTGSTGTQSIVMGFHGDAITELEYRHSLALAAEITGGSSSWLLDLVLGPRWSSNRIVSSIMLSDSYRPVGDTKTVAQQVAESKRQIYDRIQEKSGCVILVGAPIYNLMTYHVMEDEQTHFVIHREGHGESAIRGVRDLHDRDEPDHVREEDEENQRYLDYFVIEKLTVRDTTVFICAGTCTSATAAALDLLRDWSRLRASYADGDFAMLWRSQSSIPNGREEAPVRSVRMVRGYPG